MPSLLQTLEPGGTSDRSACLPKMDVFIDGFLGVLFAPGGQMTSEKPFHCLSQIFVGWEADEVRHCYALFRPPSPKPIVQLSLQWAFQWHPFYVSGLGLLSHGSAIGHILMAGGAEDQRLVFACRHDLDPGRFFSTIISFQVFQRPDVMHLN